MARHDLSKAVADPACLPVLTAGAHRAGSRSLSATPMIGPGKDAAGSQPATPRVLTGREAILRAQPQLQQLAKACGQAGSADYIDYFLTQPYTGRKTPHLLLFHTSGSTDGAAMLEGAVLVHEYRMLGMRSGVFVTEDTSGERNILGPLEARSALAVRAATFLLRQRRAHVAVLSLADGSFHPPPDLQDAQEHWGCRQRTLLRRLPLMSTYQATLDTLGAHTRRNFRLFRRRAISTHACTFVPEVALSEAEFIALNSRCDYPVPHRVARWRYRSVHAAQGGVLAGVRASNGDWISMVGGRRYHGTFAVDWQMNRSDFARISPATLMRGYLMEHEAMRGTASLLFQGGTPHSMQSAFRRERVADLVGSATTLTARVLRQVARRIGRAENFLLETLAGSDLQWESDIEA